MLSRTSNKSLTQIPIIGFPRKVISHTRYLSSLPIAVSVSAEKVYSESLTWRNLELATRALHRDGLVVMENVIDTARLDILNKKMAGDKSPYNYNKWNIQQDPPLTKAFFDPSIIINPIAIQVTTSVLGPKPRLSFVSGNSALSPTSDSVPQSQPVHSDADFKHPESPFALVVNVPLVGMDEQNGSTEVWLGSHINTSLASQEGRHGERDSGRIPTELLDQRRQERPPCQPLVKKGSIVIRDLRWWHAGKPNYTKRTRVMLAMINFAPWFRNTMEVKSLEDLRPILETEGCGLQIQANFVPDEFVQANYLKGKFGNAYDFDQKEPLKGFSISYVWEGSGRILAFNFVPMWKSPRENTYRFDSSLQSRYCFFFNQADNKTSVYCVINSFSPTDSNYRKSIQPS